jgi:hypothetical protein
LSFLLSSSSLSTGRQFSTKNSKGESSVVRFRCLYVEWRSGWSASWMLVR